jgi:branched-chain amino acid transport system ATP-binding protein
LANSLVIEDLHAGYGAVRVLSGVSLRAGDGETVALLGTNGNGKSTLIKCVTGQLRPSRGRIVAQIDGETHDLVGMPAQKVVDLGISLVAEGRRLFPRLTVEENLLLGALRRAARAHIKRNLEFCFEAFPRLIERRRQLAGSMSGGEQQMLALARAIMSSPRILIVDEPSVGLAPILVARTIDKIAELKKALGLTVLMAEQNLPQAIRIADRGYVLVHGEIVFTAHSPDALRESDLVRRLYLGIEAPAEAAAG